MKKAHPLLIVCFVGIACLLLGAATNKTPLLRAFLQSNMDGAGFSITNALQYVATGTPGFVGDASGLTGIPTLAGNNTWSGANLFSGGSLTVTEPSQFSSDINISANITVTGGITNSSLAPSEIVATDAHTPPRLKNVANGGSATYLTGTAPPVFQSIPFNDLDFPTVTANTIFAGPATGSSGTALFRNLVGKDFTDGSILLAKLAQSTASSGQFPQWSGSAWVPAFLSPSDLPAGVITNHYAASNPGILLSNDVAINVAHKLTLSNLTVNALMKAATDNTVVSGDLSGDVTTSGTLATTLKNTGTAGTYTKPTFDAQGRETSGTSAVLASSDFANQGTTTTVLHGNASGNPSFGSVALGSDVSGTLAAGQFPALTGDVTTTAGSLATTLKATGTAGTYTKVTFDAQGRETSGTTADLSGSDVTGTLAAGRFPALTGDITTSAGSLATALKSTGTAGTYYKTTFDAQGRETSGVTTVAMADIVQPGLILTNGYAPANPTAVISNNLAVDITHAFYPSNATPSRLAMIGADGTVTNASAASAAAPANLNGTATTMAQISALGTIAGTSLPIISFTSFGFSTGETFVQATPNYMRIQGAPPAAGGTTEANISQAIFQQGYFTNLWWNENAGGTSTNFTVTLMTNGVASNLASTIVGVGGTLVNGFDSTHGVPLTGASNNVSLKFSSTNPSVSAGLVVNWSIRFVSYP